MGISFSDFWQMTIQEILNAHRGWYDSQKVEWERTRWLGTIQANSMGAKVKPKDLLTFPWEDGGRDLDSEIELLKERRKWLTKQ